MEYHDDGPSTPGEALTELLAGNDRFVAGTRIHPNQDADYRAALATAQRPFAVVFGCSDSRLAAEMIFDRGLGDLFVVRTAGHIVGPEVLASISYGVAVLAISLVVVLGHDSCGAIQAAIDALAGDVPTAPELRVIIDRVTPSIERTKERGSTDQGGVTDAHVQRTVEMLSRPGTTLGDAVSAGTCAVVGMTYRLADSRITVVTPELVNGRAGD